MVISPDLSNLPFVEKNGVKYFELIAEPVKREILPGLLINAWGYNGTTPGPTILVYPGDFVNIRVYNRLSESTSVHWHGLDVPNVMDGVPDVEPTPKIDPNGYFDYRFKIVNPPGTHMYHTHHNVPRQEMMGLEGGLIILEPDHTAGSRRDYFIMLQEFAVPDLPEFTVKPGTYDIDPYGHGGNFNFFTMNGRCFPFTSPMEVSYGDNVRIRLGNAMEQAHPIHIHGHQVSVSAIDGNPIPQYSRLIRSTVLVASGQTWDLEFNANNPGIWPFHCHIPHHMANNFTDPSGGMFTTIVYKKRDKTF